MTSYKRLYNDKDEHTHPGHELEKRIKNAVDPIIYEYVRQEFSPMDIQTTVLTAIERGVSRHKIEMWQEA